MSVWWITNFTNLKLDLSIMKQNKTQVTTIIITLDPLSGL